MHRIVKLRSCVACKDGGAGTRDHRGGATARMKATIILPVVRAVPWQVFGMLD